MKYIGKNRNGHNFGMRVYQLKYKTPHPPNPPPPNKQNKTNLKQDEDKYIMP